MCPGEDNYLVSFRLKVEEAQSGRKDDTAVNDAQFKCTYGEILSASSGGNWGNWGDWSPVCPTGFCGIQTKVEGPQGNDDDTGLNDVRFMCGC